MIDNETFEKFVKLANDLTKELNLSTDTLKRALALVHDQDLRIKELEKEVCHLQRELEKADVNSVDTLVQAAEDELFAKAVFPAQA